MVKGKACWLCGGKNWRIVMSGTGVGPRTIRRKAMVVCLSCHTVYTVEHEQVRS